ncbi:MAG TPA: hypothetical protein VFQ39_01975 [Longimicrobium sp.]|nr:hypothetical protein [Longimicrobium sp.]
MDALLRRWVEWKGRSRAAQVIIYDGAAEYEKTRSFVRGILAGVLGMSVFFALTAPTSVDPTLLEEAANRQLLVEQAHERADQAVELAQLCLKTASKMDQTLASYQKVLRSP